MNRRRAQVVGVAMLAAAGLLALPGVSAGPLAVFAAAVTVVVVGLFAGLLGLAVTAGTDERPARPRHRSGSRPSDDDAVGEAVDRGLAVLAGEREGTGGWHTVHELGGSRGYDRAADAVDDHLRTELRELAVEALVERGLDREAAAVRIERGDWTDDPRAAAYLGDATLPLSVRVRDWAAGDGPRRRAEHAIAAVAALDEVTPGEAGGRLDLDWFDGDSDAADDPDRNDPADDGLGERSAGSAPRSAEDSVALAEETASRSGRWDVGAAVALVCASAGIVAGSATLLAAGVVGATFAAYGAVTRHPGGVVVVERTVSDARPAPGQGVTVTVSVENAGQQPVPELRVVDAPPADLETTGAVEHCTSLSPGEAESFEYELEARRGQHSFGPVALLARNASGSAQRTAAADVATPVACRMATDAPALGGQTTPFDGRVDADAAGEGLAFHSVRAFRPSDPLSRIDWRRYARTGELSTVEFRETRAARVVVAVDSRPPSRVARRDGEPTGADLSAAAGGAVARRLLDANNLVGAALLECIYGQDTYLAPAAGREQAVRIRRFLGSWVESSWMRGPDAAANPVADGGPRAAGGRDSDARASDTGDGGPRATGPTASRRPPDRDHEVPDWFSRASERPAAKSTPRWLSELRDRLPRDAQVVVCSPLLDEAVVDAVERLSAHGHAVTVLSPDVTTAATPGGTVARLRRRRFCRRLRPAVRVVEWSPDEPLATAVDRAAARWSG